jgi:hypothetical protein
LQLHCFSRDQFNAEVTQELAGDPHMQLSMVALMHPELKVQRSKTTHHVDQVLRTFSSIFFFFFSCRIFFAILIEILEPDHAEWGFLIFPKAG